MIPFSKLHLTSFIANLEFALALSRNESLKVVTTGGGRAMVVALGYSEETAGCERWMAVMDVDGVDGVDGWEEALERSEEAVREKLGELAATGQGYREESSQEGQEDGVVE